MAVFRVEKNHNYTVMSNYHLRDTRLTLKSIGLLSKMLSLTDEWDYPYVWGGSTPATSFDCSGFVSYVYNNCGVGWSFGRLGAEGLRQLCTRVSAANLRPGDLVFFQGTYDTTGASHVGIYVGNDMMLHCGDPIQYTSLNSSYWQSHFLAYGRLPAP